MHKRDGSVFFGCFSPPVMIGTFLIELIGAGYVVYRYKLSLKGRLIVLLLINLAIFQMAEFFVCQQTSFALMASRAGYASITLLPVLGYHLMLELCSRKDKKHVLLLYALALVIVAHFLTSPGAFDGYECTGNYVIFQIGEFQAWAYGTYYFGLLAITIGMGARYLKTAKKKRFSTVWWLTLGYLIFIVPVAILIIFQPDSRRAIPSILCGFAVTLAVILVARLAPLSLKKR